MTAARTAPPPAPPPTHGRFRPYRGPYVPQPLVAALQQLSAEYARARADPSFWAELDGLLRTLVGRPTPLYPASRLTDHARALAPAGGGAAIWLKREDLAHTGAHKINNTLGQGL